MRFDLAGWGRDGMVSDHSRFIALFQRADALGFDGVWFNEFHFNRETLPYPAPLLLGAEVLGRTERLRFGTSVLLLALYHPLLLAEQVAQLDFQSGGRVDVGIGRGTDPATFAALGIPAEETRPRFEEALAILRRAWTSPTVSAEGRFWRFSEVAVGPPPVQQPHPPLYVAGYTEETIAFAAEHGLPLLFSLEPPEARQIVPFRRLLAERGSLEPLRRSSLSRYVLVGKSAAEAEAAVDDLLPRLNRRRAEFAARRGGPPATPITRERLLGEQAIAGDPETCLGQIAALVDATGVESLRCYFNGNGALADEAALAGMELFAQEVMPAARRLAVAAAR